MRIDHIDARTRAAWRLEIENGIDTVKYVGAAQRAVAMQMRQLQRRLVAEHIRIEGAARRVWPYEPLIAKASVFDREVTSFGARGARSRSRGAASASSGVSR